MISKNQEHQKAIKLRLKGLSYSEIIKELPVSQSSLSLWLRNIPLSKTILNKLSEKKRRGQSKGGLAKRLRREKQQAEIIQSAEKQISKLTRKEFWLLGIMAYWCEGSKQKEGNISQPVTFTNSDTFLIRLYAKWLKEVCMINESDIQYNLYIHEKADIRKAIDYWSEVLRVPAVKFDKPVLKKHNALTKRKNIEEQYHGLIRISVKKSTNLNRIIKGWTIGISNNI